MEDNYVHTPFGRYTLIEGVLYKGVTSIIHNALPSPEGLQRWQCYKGFDKAKQYMHQRAAIGTDVHDKIEQFILGNVDAGVAIEELDSQEKKFMFSNFLKWVKDYNPIFKSAEFKVKSDEYGYAGTVDCTCEIKGKKWIIDWKTSSAIRPEYGLQISAYKNGILEMYPEFSKHKLNLGVLNIRQEGYKFEDFTKKDSINFNTFKSCIDVHKWVVRNQFDFDEEIKKIGMVKYKDYF